MNAYLIIDILIVFIPLLLSFENKVSYYKKFREVFLSITVVGLIFIAWDIYAVINNHWSFNKIYVSEFSVFNLPPEEILFFVAVPYSIIFLFSVIKYYVRERNLKVSKIFPAAGLILFITAGYIFRDKDYTEIVFYFTGLIFLLMLIRMDLITNTFLYCIALSYIPFLIVNYLLTSLPVVEYNPAFITGIKTFTIPLEDYFYSFTMISGWLIAYIFFTGKKNDSASNVCSS